MLYKLNENTKILVKTSVGASKTAPIKGEGCTVNPILGRSQPLEQARHGSKKFMNY